MSVYIPGMEMPTSCFECKLLDYTDTFRCRYRFESLAREHGINISRPSWCPLIPVPEHGRLIDADKIEFFEAYLNGHYERGDDEVALKEEIDKMPTIIPADKEVDG